VTAAAAADTVAARPAGRAGLWSVRAAGVAGIVFAALTIAVLFLLRDQPPSADAGLVAWYVAEHDRLSTAVYLIPFAGIAFLWFVAVVRRRIGRAEDQFYSTIFLASALLYVAMFFAAGASATSAVGFVSDNGALTDVTLILVGRSLAQTLFYVFAVKMSAAFMLVTSSIGLRSGVLPRWFALLGMAAALLMLLSVGFLEPVAVVFPLWVGAVSLLVLRLPREAWATL
jgi:hypothetical protein